MNQDVNENKKLFWNEVSKVNGENVASVCRIKYINGKFTLEVVEVRRIRKEYFEDLYNTDTQEQVAVLMCG